MELNSSQYEAVMHVDGPCLVLAGPGSGKTAVLTRRIVELIKSGIPAEEILVITFTKAAAIEMKERFLRLSDDVYPVTFGTFHSLFWGILQEELGYKASDVLLGNNKTKLLKQAMEKARLDSEDTVLLNAFMAEASRFNNLTISMDLYTPKYVDKEDFKVFLKSYQELKNKYRLIDFDDMLSKARQLFKNNPDCLKRWQSRFKYFLVDEMQDMNDIQFELINTLASNTNNIFCVGDDDQSIYGFRGANPKVMQLFLEKYKDARQILLNYNYRNPINVVESAGNLIEKNKMRFPKNITAVAKEGVVDIKEYKNEEEEAEGVYKRIQALIEMGVKHEDIVILFRNHSDARFIVNKLISKNVPFFLKEQMPNVFTHFIINDIEAYFQIAIGNSTRARLLSILNRPNRYLHRMSVEKGKDLKGMCDFYKDNGACLIKVEALKNDLNLLAKMSPCAGINYIKNVMGYTQFLKEEALRLDADFDDYKSILDFLSSVFKDSRTIKQAIDKLNELRLKIDYENKNKALDKKGKIGLYTLHSSKGLEFEDVFIIGVNEGVIPTNKIESKEDLEGERRLFYVGITRTKKNLYLSYTNKKNRDKSRFLDELNVIPRRQ